MIRRALEPGYTSSARVWASLPSDWWPRWHRFYERISYLLNRPVGRPSNEVRRYHASFSYQAATWDKPRRVIAKVEWHPGELYPRAGFIVTSMSRPAE